MELSPAMGAQGGGHGRAAAWTDVLTLGFGSTAAMWAAGFICRLPAGPLGQDPVAPPPPVQPIVPAAVLFALLLACMFGGGFLAGRYCGRGWRGGLYVGALSSALNLLILLGLWSDTQTGGAPTALLFLPGSLLTGAAIGALGAAAGSRFRPSALTPDWPWAFSLVAAAATLLLIFIGGLVTSLRAGLAVPDWPNTFGYLMFLYPLSRMSGGVYFEHSHRLLGTLVGLTVLALALQVLLVERRRAVRRLALGALALVVVQGVLGGLRVTGGLTLSASREELFPSTTLAVVHGIVAQVILALLAALAALLSPAWRAASPDQAPQATPGERSMHAGLVGVLLVQLFLGAILRHNSQRLLLHVMAGAAVTAAAVAVGARAWGTHGARRIPGEIGRALLLLSGAQMLLGLAALLMLGFSLDRRPTALAQVLLTSGHQTAGAMLLAAAVLLLLWGRRK